MTKFFKVTLVSLAIVSAAGAAHAGNAKGFDLDKFMQEVEAGTTLYTK